MRLNTFPMVSVISCDGLSLTVTESLVNVKNRPNNIVLLDVLGEKKALQRARQKQKMALHMWPNLSMRCDLKIVMHLYKKLLMVLG